MKSDRQVEKALKRVRKLFRKMPPYVVDHLFGGIIRNTDWEWDVRYLTRTVMDTEWGRIFRPYSFLQVAWMTWELVDIEISDRTLHPLSMEDITLLLDDQANSLGPAAGFCRSKLASYINEASYSHTIQGDPLIVLDAGGLYKLLSGHARVAGAFMAGQWTFTTRAWRGVVPSKVEQEKIILSAIQATQKDLAVKEYCCMVPGCQFEAIGSHSQQHNGQLDNIADSQGNVYALLRDKTRSMAGVFFRQEEMLPKMVKVNINQATVFPGYCNSHDTSVFAEVEKRPLVKDSPGQVLAFHIRGLSYVNARQRYEFIHTSMIWNKLCQQIGLMLPHQQLFNWRIYVPGDYRMLIAPCFQRDAIKNIRWVWRVINKNIGVSCCSAITPMDDNDADRYVGASTDYGKMRLNRARPFATLNVVPLSDSTHVIVAWHKDINILVKKLADQLASSDIIEFQHALNDVIFNRSEDFTVAPKIWEALSDARRHEFEFALIPEHIRGKMVEVPELVDLSGCEVS